MRARVPADARRGSRRLVPHVARRVRCRRPAACVACRVPALRVPRPLQCGCRRGTAVCVCAAAAAITARQPPSHGHGGGGGGAGESARRAAAAVWCSRCRRVCERQPPACVASCAPARAGAAGAPSSVLAPPTWPPRRGDRHCAGRGQTAAAGVNWCVTRRPPSGAAASGARWRRRRPPPDACKGGVRQRCRHQCALHAQ